MMKTASAMSEMMAGTTWVDPDSGEKFIVVSIESAPPAEDGGVDDYLIRVRKVVPPAPGRDTYLVSECSTDSGAPGFPYLLTKHPGGNYAHSVPIARYCVRAEANDAARRLQEAQP